MRNMERIHFAPVVLLLASAAALVAQEAGATVTDALGATLRFNSTRGEMFGVLACAPALHDAALERLRLRAPPEKR